MVISAYSNHLKATPIQSDSLRRIRLNLIIYSFIGYRKIKINIPMNSPVIMASCKQNSIRIP